MTIELSQFELEFINLYGEAFENAGKSRTMGRMFGLFILRAQEDVSGLDQEDLVSYFEQTDKPISMSTVSRTLNKMEKVGYISYSLEIHEERARRKYFMKSDLKEMALDRMRLGIEESHMLINRLQGLRTRIETKNKEDNKQIVFRIQKFIKMYEALVELYQEFLERADEILES